MPYRELSCATLISPSFPHITIETSPLKGPGPLFAYGISQLSLAHTKVLKLPPHSLHDSDPQFNWCYHRGFGDGSLYLASSPDHLISCPNDFLMQISISPGGNIDNNDISRAHISSSSLLYCLRSQISYSPVQPPYRDYLLFIASFPDMRPNGNPTYFCYQQAGSNLRLEQFGQPSSWHNITGLNQNPFPLEIRFSKHYAPGYLSPDKFRSYFSSHFRNGIIAPIRLSDLQPQPIPF